MARASAVVPLAILAAALAAPPGGSPVRADEPPGPAVDRPAALPSALPEALPITLDEALSLAETRNFEIAASRESAAGQAERAAAVRRAAFPRASVLAGWSKTNLPASLFASTLNAREFTAADFAIENLNHPPAESFLNGAARLEWPIDLFGKVGAEAAGAESTQRSAEASASESRQDVLFRTVEAYYRTGVADRAAGITRRALEAALAREADLETRVSAGAALEADRLRAKSRRREREADLADRRADFRVAQASLAQLLGSEDPHGYIPAEGPPAPLAIDPDATVWIARATAGRPVLRVVAEQQSASRWSVERERRGSRPDVGVLAQVEETRTLHSGNGNSWAVGASLIWDVWDPGRARRVAAARSDERSQDATARSWTDRVRLEVVTAHERALASLQRYQAALGGAEEARESLRVAEERRRAGLATLTDELEIESAALAAGLSEVRAAADAAISRAALLRAVGELGGAK